MKKYMKPTMTGELFTANEFVSACGESGVVYKFICDAPAGRYYSDGDGDGDMELLNSGYRPCGATHEVESSEVFKKGFIDYNKNGKEDDGEAVMCWLIYSERWGETYVSNGHATKKVNMNTWETVKS